MWADIVEGETRDGFGFILKGRVNDIGYRSITIPGSLKAYYEAHSAFGTKPWREIVQPAIDYAENGFMVRPHVHQFWTQKESAFGRVDTADKLALTESGRRIYFDEQGKLKGPGSIVRNPDMARTLRRIAEGRSEEHTSELQYPMRS